MLERSGRSLCNFHAEPKEESQEKRGGGGGESYAFEELGPPGEGEKKYQFYNISHLTKTSENGPRH